MKRLRILLGNHNPRMLTLLQALLEPDHLVVGTAEDGDALVAAAQALRPNLVLIPLDLPVRHGIAAVRDLQETMPDCRVIVHSTLGEPDVMAAAFAAGATAFVIATEAPESLVSSIKPIIRQILEEEGNGAARRKGAVRSPYAPSLPQRSSLGEHVS
jgi:two-component system response regulator DesR